MRTINNGGPAFPVPGLQHDEDFNGMTLREYYAAHAPFTLEDANRILQKTKEEGEVVTGKRIMEMFVAMRWYYADMMIEGSQK